MTYAREPHGMTDSLIRTWFNNIATNLGASHHRTNKDIIRCFDARTATKGPAGGYTLLKPDLSVISGTPHDSNQAHATERLHWREIYAFVEITGQKTGAEAHVTAQIAEKAACIFDVQHQGNSSALWASLASLITSNSFFAIVDRAGQTFTPSFQHVGSQLRHLSENCIRFLLCPNQSSLVGMKA